MWQSFYPILYTRHRVLDEPSQKPTDSLLESVELLSLSVSKCSLPFNPLVQYHTRGELISQLRLGVARTLQGSKCLNHVVLGNRHDP